MIKVSWNCKERKKKSMRFSVFHDENSIYISLFIQYNNMTGITSEGEL